MVPDWFLARLGWKTPDPESTKAKDVCRRAFGHEAGRECGPNLADLNGASSTFIAGEIYRLLGISPAVTRDFDLGELELEDTEPESGDAAVPTSEGITLEKGLESEIRETLDSAEPLRRWYVTRKDVAHDFAQFAHMQRFEQLAASDAMKELRKEFPEFLASLPRDYNGKSDVMVGLPDPTDDSKRLLHAVVSSKLTLRSDRAQNVRTEFGVLIRNRRGRLPHLVVVTAEPLPSRLESLTRGTGEIDANYHLLFEVMDQAINNLVSRTDLPSPTLTGLTKQAIKWREMVDGGRMRPYSTLIETLRRT
ncbi:NgoMIV family type II restriction endonuclease [Actinoplanes sp. NPDC023936]|uniref:NgoMIV family type II restriction endonuclease n=1 Tax=Actinoplanes sp. NPDC023936 TaxID=3154910 RepID=UPI0033C3EC5B